MGLLFSLIPTNTSVPYDVEGEPSLLDTLDASNAGPDVCQNPEIMEIIRTLGSGSGAGVKEDLMTRINNLPTDAMCRACTHTRCICVSIDGLWRIDHIMSKTEISGAIFNILTESLWVIESSRTSGEIRSHIRNAGEQIIFLSKPSTTESILSRVVNRIAFCDSMIDSDLLDRVTAMDDWEDAIDATKRDLDSGICAMTDKTYALTAIALNERLKVLYENKILQCEERLALQTTDRYEKLLALKGGSMTAMIRTVNRLYKPKTGLSVGLNIAKQMDKYLAEMQEREVLEAVRKQQLRVFVSQRVRYGASSGSDTSNR